jgi:hypothetical protein
LQHSALSTQHSALSTQHSAFWSVAVFILASVFWVSNANAAASNIYYCYQVADLGRSDPKSACEAAFPWLIGETNKSVPISISNCGSGSYPGGSYPVGGSATLVLKTEVLGCSQDLSSIHENWGICNVQTSRTLLCPEIDPIVIYDVKLAWGVSWWPIRTPNLTLTPAPNQSPPDPRPKGAEGKEPKSSSLELIAKVMEGSAPKVGVTVGFGLGVEAYTGGHAHGDLGSIPRPKGKLSKLSGETDANGEIKLTFFADEPAGLHAIVADCAPASCAAPAKHVVKVKVPDLIHIPPDTETPPRYTLVGNVGDSSNGYKTFQHNLTHYLTEQSWSNLKTLISTFIDLDWGQIGINDASLEWGGLFDIEGKWTTSGGHAEHRDGKQVDISFVRPLSISSDKRQKVFDEVCASKGAALPVVLWHQNDGYAPHFHIYLTGQSVTGAKKQCSKQ